MTYDDQVVDIDDDGLAEAGFPNARGAIDRLKP
jgi:hypothetical protein